MMRTLPGEKLQRQIRFYQKNVKKRKRGDDRNHHHMTNACKGGKSIPSNLLLIKKDRHSALHRVFKNMSWEEIGDALESIFNLRDPERCYEVVKRISRMKGRTM